MPPIKAVSYAMLAVAMVVALQADRPLLLLAVATGALGLSLLEEPGEVACCRSACRASPPRGTAQSAGVSLPEVVYL